MEARYILRPDRLMKTRDDKIYGHFIEHFHRQIYGGVYDPQSPFADETGLRGDVIDAMRTLRIPILRWPGGCFVSSYHWKKAVGPRRTPVFDKSWRVEDPNTFGTDEYIALCRRVGCEPYICTNAGTGTIEEMSDWVEYCNLPSEGEFARMRIANGHPSPYRVKYWSIGNENYGSWELGAKDRSEWGRLVLEGAKLMQHVDPRIELSAAALPDLDWNVALLKACGQHLEWISIHKYWNLMPQENDLYSYEQAMACTDDLDTDIQRVRGLLTAMDLDHRIRIAYDEWNLRGWHHPNVHTVRQGRTREEYLDPRDKNDLNSSYTMADAVFTACFLNTLNRHADIVGMACFAPVVNTRGCIFTHPGGIVRRSTYHVFDLYVNHLGSGITDGWMENSETMTMKDKGGREHAVPVLDVISTRCGDGTVAVAAVNKHPCEERTLTLCTEGRFAPREIRILRVNGDSTESFNDIGTEQVKTEQGEWLPASPPLTFTLPPHSVQVIEIRE